MSRRIRETQTQPAHTPPIRQDDAQREEDEDEEVVGFLQVLRTRGYNFSSQKVATSVRRIIPHRDVRSCDYLLQLRLFSTAEPIKIPRPSATPIVINGRSSTFVATCSNASLP